MATASKPELEVVLLGKTGNGKSATGNLILGYDEFLAKTHHDSITKDVASASSERDRHIIRVVDTPGLADTGLTMMEDKEKTVKSMANVFIECPEGVHIFALVVRLDARLTPEEKEVFSSLKKVFGGSYLKDHGMVIVTHGETFEDMLEDDELDIPFEQWIKNDGQGALGELFKECDYRCVLFENKTRKETKRNAQFEDFIKVAEKLRTKGIYTNEHFQRFEEKRREMIESYKAPYLKRSIQQGIDLLRADASYIKNDCGREDNIKAVKARAQELLKKVEEANDPLLREIQGDLQRICDVPEDVPNEQIRAMCESLKKYKLPPIGYIKAFMKYGISEVWSYLTGTSDLHIS